MDLAKIVDRKTAQHCKSCLGVVVDNSIAVVHSDRQVEKRQRFSDLLLDEVYLLVAPDGDKHSAADVSGYSETKAELEWKKKR